MSFNKYDIILHPFYVYVNISEPQETIDKIISEFPEIKEVKRTPFVEIGNALVVKRTAFEFIEPPEPLKPIFENTTTCNECCGDMVKRTVEEQIKHEMELIKKKLNIEEK